MDAQGLIRHYRDCYYEKQGRRPRRPHGSVTEDVQQAQRVLAWCAERLIDPQALVRVRFDHSWAARRACPRLTQLCVDGAVAAARSSEVQTSIPAPVPAFTQAVRDLSYLEAGHEQVRRRYHLQMQHVLCAVNALAGGYDPRSRYCPSCPRAAACAARLNQRWGFDVVALRAGRLERVPAVVRRALGGQDGVSV